ncbi:MAG TPA: hypothetical protein VLA56_08625, partial [Pseudomonadales bacterium]|nr:hypothetical protein [Pseudomonadales bacterium]
MTRVLIGFLLGALLSASCSEGDLRGNSPPGPISLVEIIARTEKAQSWDGYRVHVWGFLGDLDGSAVLTLSRDLYEAGDLVSIIRLLPE